MANQVISMQQIRSIIQLLEKGFSLRAISAQLGMSRQPVTLYAARLKSTVHSLEQLRAFTDADLAAIVYATTASPVVATDARKLYLSNLFPYFLAELKRKGVTRCCFGKNTESNAKALTGIRSFVSFLNRRPKSIRLPCTW